MPVLPCSLSSDRHIQICLELTVWEETVYHLENFCLASSVDTKSLPTLFIRGLWHLYQHPLGEVCVFLHLHNSFFGFTDSPDLPYPRRDLICSGKLISNAWVAIQLLSSGMNEYKVSRACIRHLKTETHVLRTHGPAVWLTHARSSRSWLRILYQGLSANMC